MNYKSLLQLMQQYEPQPQQYLFKHTYDAAKSTYDNCIRVVNEALCRYCTESGHCEWFCDGEYFDHDQVLQDIKSGKGLKPIGTNSTGLKKGELIMTIKQIYLITISKTTRIQNQQYIAKLEINNPTLVEWNHEATNLYEEKENLVIWTPYIYFKDLFSEDSEVIITGLFITDNNKEIKGTWNIMTGEFKEEN